MWSSAICSSTESRSCSPAAAAARTAACVRSIASCISWRGPRGSSSIIVSWIGDAPTTRRSLRARRHRARAGERRESGRRKARETLSRKGEIRAGPRRRRTGGLAEAVQNARASAGAGVAQASAPMARLRRSSQRPGGRRNRDDGTHSKSAAQALSKTLGPIGACIIGLGSEIMKPRRFRENTVHLLLWDPTSSVGALLPIRRERTMPAHVDEGVIGLQVEARKPFKDEPRLAARDARVAIRNRLKMVLLAILLSGLARLRRISGERRGWRPARAPARDRLTFAPWRQLSPSLDDADPRAVDLWLDQVRAASAHAALSVPCAPALPQLTARDLARAPRRTTAPSTCASSARCASAATRRAPSDDHRPHDVHRHHHDGERRAPRRGRKRSRAAHRAVPPAASRARDRRRCAPARRLALARRPRGVAAAARPRRRRAAGRARV